MLVGAAAAAFVGSVSAALLESRVLAWATLLFVPLMCLLFSRAMSRAEAERLGGRDVVLASVTALLFLIVLGLPGLLIGLVIRYQLGWS